MLKCTLRAGGFCNPSVANFCRKLEHVPKPGSCTSKFGANSTTSVTSVHTPSARTGPLGVARSPMAWLASEVCRRCTAVGPSKLQARLRDQPWARPAPGPASDNLVAFTLVLGSHVQRHPRTAHRKSSSEGRRKAFCCVVGTFPLRRRVCPLVVGVLLAVCVLACVYVRRSGI